MSAPAPVTFRLRLALRCAALGTLVSLILFAYNNPYTLVAFMFVGQPLLLAASVLFAIELVGDLRRRGAL